MRTKRIFGELGYLGRNSIHRLMIEMSTPPKLSFFKGELLNFGGVLARARFCVKRCFLILFYVALGSLFESGCDESEHLKRYVSKYYKTLIIWVMLTEVILPSYMRFIKDVIFGGPLSRNQFKDSI